MKRKRQFIIERWWAWRFFRLCVSNNLAILCTIYYTNQNDIYDVLHEGESGKIQYVPTPTDIREVTDNGRCEHVG